MMSEIFDFGFTAVTEEELESVQTLQQTVVESEGFEDRLHNLYNAIQPLLTNLRKDPEKEYILWPNRLERVEQFSDYLDAIYKGEK
ncbi:hypothetical protein N9A42_00545 [bacterium]|jgi:hypothetical protein|nr:hypothetical protein [bacterium]